MSDAAADGSAPLPPWRVERSRYVLRDCWISVRADDCVTDDGVAVAPFYVLDYPDWVQIVALDEDDHVILIRQYRHGLGATSLELPTGAIEFGEEPIAAGKRELVEETGFAASDWRYVAALSPNAATHANRVHVVVARAAVATAPPADDATERTALVRVPIGEAAALALGGAIMQEGHVGALLMALHRIGCWPPRIGN